MKKLVLLRHGESTWNKENRFTGWTDVGLTRKRERRGRRSRSFSRRKVLSLMWPSPRCSGARSRPSGS